MKHYLRLSIERPVTHNGKEQFIETISKTIICPDWNSAMKKAEAYHKAADKLHGYPEHLEQRMCYRFALCYNYPGNKTPDKKIVIEYR